MERDYVIVGGGVAGLSGANRLVDLGIEPMVIEAGHYPSHKVCGEHFSYEALPILREWQLAPAREIPVMQMHVGGSSYFYPLPYPSASGSRYSFDNQLCDRARRLGAEIRTGTQVVDLKPGAPCKITLSTGEVILAKRVLIGTGRISNASPPKRFPYIGLKAHFSEVADLNRLEMHLLDGAYCGLSPIENGHHNLAILAHQKHLKTTPEETFKHLLSQRSAEALRDRLSSSRRLFSDWKVAVVPHFGERTPPVWEGCYFLGDAMGSIAPASGDGLAMAVTSGWLAAEYALADDPDGFRWAWRKVYRHRLRWAAMLHRVMMRPALAKGACRLAHFYPPLSDTFFHRTRN